MRLLLCGFVLCGVCHAGVTLSILPNPQSVPQGSELTVGIYISGLGSGTSLGTYDINVAFDATLLTYSSMSFGSQLNPRGLGDIQSVTPNGGSVEVFELSLDSASILNAQQASSFLLATLTFNTIATGMNSPIALSINAIGDALGNSVAASLQNGTVNIVPNQPPPLQLFSSGPVSLQVVQNESLTISGTATLTATQPITWTASTTTSWLSLNQSSGSFPGGVSMTAKPTGLDVGVYSGSVVVAAGSQTLTVPVTLTVLAPAPMTFTPSVFNAAFSYPAGSAGTYNLELGPAGVAFAARTSAFSSGWLSINPSSGVGPATIRVVADASKATPGTYQDSIVITSAGAPNSPLVIPVSMAVSGLIPTLPQQINSAAGAGPDRTVAPNEIVSLFLSDFSCQSQPVVNINGTAVAWSSYAPGQINYAVPSTTIQPSLLSVVCNGATAWTFNELEVTATVPGIFTLAGTGSGQASAVNADGTTNSSANPASRGSYISFYVTGFGVFNSASADGLRRLAGTVTAQIGGVTALVEYAGEAPGNTDGLQQINVLIPANAPSGATIPVALEVNGIPAQTTATIAVD